MRRTNNESVYYALDGDARLCRFHSAAEKEQRIKANTRILAVFTSSQCKPRRLWRLAVATQSPISDCCQSAPCPEGTRIHQKPTASSEGAQLWDNRPLTLSWFRKAGPTIILNIIRDASVPLRGTIFRWRCRTYPQLRCFAACSGFLMVGPASRNPAAYWLLLQCRVILNLHSIFTITKRDKNRQI